MKKAGPESYTEIEIKKKVQMWKKLFNEECGEVCRAAVSQVRCAEVS